MVKLKYPLNETDGAVISLIFNCPIDLQGRNISYNKFFTSFNVAKELLKRNITIAGAIKKHVVDLPLQFTKTDGRKRYSSIFGYNEHCNDCILFYQKNKGAQLSFNSS